MTEQRLPLQQMTSYTAAQVIHIAFLTCLSHQMNTRNSQSTSQHFSADLRNTWTVIISVKKLKRDMHHNRKSGEEEV